MTNELGRVVPSRMLAVDLINEALIALTLRPSRSILTSIGTVLGVGSLIVILGITATLRIQVDARFDVLRSNIVDVEDARSEPGLAFPFSPAALKRLAGLNGVISSGVAWTVRAAQGQLDAVGGTNSAEQVSLYAASAGWWKTAEPRVLEGHVYDDFHESTPTDVVVLGATAAEQLGVSNLSRRPAVLISGVPYTVVGIVDQLGVHPEMLQGAIIPAAQAVARWGPPDEKANAFVSILTQPGAAHQVAAEAGLATSAVDPGVVRAVPPPDPRTLREAVSADLTQLFLVLGAVSMLVGAVGIANITLVGVIERTNEIGLRRALGARRRHVVMQVIAESAVLGLVGGLVGASTGVLVVLGVCLVQAWSPALDPWVLVLAPGLGLVTGVLAGWYPAMRAGRIEPAEALVR